MRNPIGRLGTRSGDRFALAGAWLAVISATLIYWETCRLAHGAAAIDLRYSGLWMVEIWAGWFILSFPAWERCRRWRRSPEGVRLRNALVLMATLSFLALGCEWLLNALLAQLGEIERWESAWAMFNRRGLLCVVVPTAIVLFAARPSLVWRNLGPAEPLNPEPKPDASVTLALTGRDGPITVSPREIEAILAAENYVQICMVSGKQFLHRTTLAKMERELSSGSMLRVHRSAIVNVGQVRAKLPGGRLQLTSGRVIRIGRSFREAVDKACERPPRCTAAINPKIANC
jgi:hypothetical protein